MAVHGVYPLVFPQKGYKGQLAWLVDTAGCGGVEAYTALLAAAKEGEVELPQHVEVWHQSGQAVHLGPNLTTPSPSHLKTTPDLAIILGEEKLVAKHRQVEKDTAKRMAWEADTPDVEETDDDDDDDEENNNKPKVEKEEPQDDEEHELQKEDHRMTFKQILVEFSHADVTATELRKHFEQFGVVEEVLLSNAPLNPAIVTFESAAVAVSLVGQTHSLQHTPGRGGSVPLRLRGGSGRVRRGPPRQQRHNACPFRWVLLYYTITVCIIGAFSQIKWAKIRQKKQKKAKFERETGA